MAEDLSASNLFNVKDLVAVVTGGGTGIGLMMAKALALNGAKKVYIIGRRKEKLEEACKQSPHGNIFSIVGDVTSKDSLAAAASRIEAETGYINLLIANSGIAGPTVAGLPPGASLKQFKDFAWNYSSEDFTQTYNVNNTAVFFTVIAFLELLDAGNSKGNMSGGVSSQVVITASIASFVRVVVSGWAYVTSKAAAVSMTKAFASSMVPYGIRCNAIAPGLFPSEMTGEMMKRAESQAQDGGPPKLERSNIPAQRFGSEADMGAAILNLTSKGGAYLNGNVTVVDGGRLCNLPATY